MVDQVWFYISAASDLEAERELIGRSIPEVPVTLGWRIIHSPIHGEKFDPSSVERANLHILLIGEDIRAPIGVEWAIARRSKKQPLLFLKQGIERTPAAVEFIRHVENVSAWQPYQDAIDLRAQLMSFIAEHLLSDALFYSLTMKEIENLQEWKKKIDESRKEPIDDTRGGAGESGVILSPERCMPSEGVLIQPKAVKKGRK